MTPRYLEVEMPKRFILEFRTEDGGWMDWGAYPRRLFARQPDGSYVCSGHSSTVWIRCVAVHDGWFEHADIDGEVTHHYRLVPLPPEPGDT
ncbi:MAG: hypothetical protein ACRDLL_04450 [Solirubrobacterales bacterium]